MKEHSDMGKYEAPFGSAGEGGTVNGYGHHIKGIRGHLTHGMGEFVGTVMFLWFALAGHLMAVDQASDAVAGEGGRSSQMVVFVALAHGQPLNRQIFVGDDLLGHVSVNSRSGRSHDFAFVVLLFYRPNRTSIADLSDSRGFLCLSRSSTGTD